MSHLDGACLGYRGAKESLFYHMKSLLKETKPLTLYYQDSLSNKGSYVSVGWTCLNKMGAIRATISDQLKPLLKETKWPPFFVERFRDN